MVKCEKCEREFGHRGSLALHAKTHIPKEGAPEIPSFKTEDYNDKTIIYDSGKDFKPAVLLEMKGWKALSKGDEHYVTDETGRKIGSFPTALEAIRFLENSNRHIRTR
jgi:hypothetical protein